MDRWRVWGISLCSPGGDFLTNVMAKNKNILVQDFRSRPFTWATQLVSVLILALATYITIRLIPIYKSIDSLVSRVQAIEERNVKVDPLVYEFIGQKETIKSIQNDIADIKTDVKRILDLHINR